MGKGETGVLKWFTILVAVACGSDPNTDSDVADAGVAGSTLGPSCQADSVCEPSCASDPDCSQSTGGAASVGGAPGSGGAPGTGGRVAGSGGRAVGGSNGTGGAAAGGSGNAAGGSDDGSGGMPAAWCCLSQTQPLASDASMTSTSCLCTRGTPEECEASGQEWLAGAVSPATRAVSEACTVPALSASLDAWCCLEASAAGVASLCDCYNTTDAQCEDQLQGLASSSGFTWTRLSNCP